jgi:hypothetical protein
MIVVWVGSGAGTGEAQAVKAKSNKSQFEKRNADLSLRMIGGLKSALRGISGSFCIAVF